MHNPEFGGDFRKAPLSSSKKNFLMSQIFTNIDEVAANDNNSNNIKRD